MTCSKCGNPSEHSIMMRLGDLPDPLDPKLKDKDKSEVHVVRFCETHWTEVRQLIPQLDRRV